jgi:TP901 family phage tail tape measure protein
MNISNDTGTAVAELAELQYSAITAGIKTADSVGFVETAVKAASAFSTDTGTIINGLTNVMNAYKMEASEAGKIAGQMLIVNNLGHTSFEELDKSMTKLLPTASRLNIGTDEVFASLAALTAGGHKTSDAVKEVEEIFKIIQNPADSVRKAARGLGLDFSETALRTKGLAGILEEIKQKTNGNSTALRRLFSDEKVFNAVNLLTVSGANSFTESLGAMQNATEKLDSAFAIIDASPAERWGDIINIIRHAGIRLGTALLPVIEKVTEKVEIFADMFANMDFDPLVRQIEILADRLMNSLEFEKIVNGIKNFFESVFKAIGTISKMVGVLWNLRLLILSIATAWGIYKAAMIAAVVISNIMGMVKAVQTLMAAQKGMNAIQAIFNVLLNANPIGLIITGIAALIAIIILCVKNWDKITAVLQKFGEWVKNVASMIRDNLCKAFQALVGFVKENSEKVLAFIAIFTGPFGFIISIIKELKDNWSAIVEVFRTDGIIEGFKRLGGVILSAVLAPIQGILETLAHIPGVGELLGPAVEKIKNFREELKGNTAAETTVVQKVVPADVGNVTPRTITQTTAAANSAAANSAAAIPAYGIDNRNNRTITAAATPVTAPMTTAEQYMYSQTTNREQIDIGVRAEQGTAANVTRGRRRSPNIRVETSGGN